MNDEIERLKEQVQALQLRIQLLEEIANTQHKCSKHHTEENKKHGGDNPKPPMTAHYDSHRGWLLEEDNPTQAMAAYLMRMACGLDDNENVVLEVGAENVRKMARHALKYHDTLKDEIKKVQHALKSKI